jgi:chemotaxis protein methyltransferase CheR
MIVMPEHQFAGQCRPMTGRIFSRFSAFIRGELGINITDAKRTMLQARLQKRMRLLGLSSFEDYYDYVFSDQGRRSELLHMIDAITTNKTDFFREPKHFDYLTQTLLPELIRTHGTGVRRRAAFWSAGCSTGEEPYTLAMVLSDFAARRPGFDFSILGTDISGEVLKKAVAGIYDHQKIAPVPMPMRKKYLLRSKDRTRNVVRVTTEIRARVTFQRLNLMESDFRLRESFDVIFFRNVIIYFDRPTQERVLHSVCRHLKPEGTLFLGHSETLNGLNVPLKPVVSTVYRKVA